MVRDRWEGVAPPPALAEAHRLFVHGREGDELYDQAASPVQAHLIELGAAPVAWLPQPD